MLGSPQQLGGKLCVKLVLSCFVLMECLQGLSARQTPLRRIHECASICRRLKANPSMPCGSMPFSNGDVVAVLISTVTSKER